MLAAAIQPPFAPDPVSIGDGVFTALDRAAVELSRADPIGSVFPAVGTLVAMTFFGPRRHYSLADPRLEALRRYAVLYRTSRGSGVNSARLGIDALTSSERRHVRSLVDGWTPAPPTEPERRAWMARTVFAVVVACVFGSGLL